MTLLALLVVLLLLFGGGGATYPGWSATGPAWGGTVLWLLALLALVLTVTRLFFPIVLAP